MDVKTDVRYKIKFEGYKYLYMYVDKQIICKKLDINESKYLNFMQGCYTRIGQ